MGRVQVEAKSEKQNLGSSTNSRNPVGPTKYSDRVMVNRRERARRSILLRTLQQIPTDLEAIISVV